MERLFFYLFAVATIVGALATVSRKSPLASAVALIVTFLGLSGLYFLERAPFVGILQVLVYAGAIMVLILFVIMFLNLPDTELAEECVSRVGLFLSLFFLIPMFALCVGVLANVAGPAKEPTGAFGSIRQVGDLMLDRYMFQFEAISILLLVAIVGAVMMAKKRI